LNQKGKQLLIFISTKNERKIKSINYKKSLFIKHEDFSFSREKNDLKFVFGIERSLCDNFCFERAVV